jgi:putative inorganic carbon (HCO3(-)) transporter
MDRPPKRKSWFTRRAPGDAALVVLAIMGVVSIVVSPLPAHSARAILPLAVGLALYGLLTHSMGRPWLGRWVWWGLIGAGVAVGVAIPLGMLPPINKVFGWATLWKAERPLLADTYNANVLAGALVLLMPFAVARALAGGAWWQRAAALAAALFMVAALVYTQSRGAYLALLVALGLLVGLRWPRLGLWEGGLGLAGILLLGWRVGWPKLLQVILATDSANGFASRLEVWPRGLLLVADMPFTGSGFGCFFAVVKAFYPLLGPPEGAVTHAHNLLLQVAVDLGLPGVLAFLVILVLALVSATRAYRTARRAEERPTMMLAAACLAALVAMLGHGMVDAAVWGNKGAFLPWVVMGLSVVLARQQHAAIYLLVGHSAKILSEKSLHEV